MYSIRHRAICQRNSNKIKDYTWLNHVWTQTNFISDNYDIYKIVCDLILACVWTGNKLYHETGFRSHFFGLYGYSEIGDSLNSDFNNIRCIRISGLKMTERWLFSSEDATSVLIVISRKWGSIAYLYARDITISGTVKRDLKNI